jgi:hypothetical protein
LRKAEIRAVDLPGPHFVQCCDLILSNSHHVKVRNLFSQNEDSKKKKLTFANTKITLFYGKYSTEDIAIKIVCLSIPNNNKVCVDPFKIIFCSAM